MARTPLKLKNSFEGALAGGGDPATSPLYVFGPFLKLIVVAGVAQITFGASVWLAVLTIAVVSAVYRLVMQWVTDGSGGSGMSEEEFGGWAVKVDAAITFIEYTLTFLVSMSAMVTFIADRWAFLGRNFLGLPYLQYRTLIAIGLSILIGWLVNRGPRMAARAFGPATAGVLLLLWAMVIASIWKYGFRLPTLDLRAFHPQYLGFTIGGYVRILAVMTGIEVFANLVAAYQGTPRQKSKKAFNSLLIIMGTTAVTMLVVGPAIFQISDPTDNMVSVFTQTMDELLPGPLAYMGTLASVAVLMSASAASAQGLQNLALGLERRRYIPLLLGKRNRFGVADKPVWLEVGIVSVCFLLFGTHEETYLAIYAAGVFILLSMAGWAVTKRLVRHVRRDFTWGRMILIVGTCGGALLTTSATAVIFEERFAEGAWTYFVFIPGLYVLFTYFRARLGEPTPVMDQLGHLDAAQLAGFGFGQVASALATGGAGNDLSAMTWQPDPIERSNWREERVSIHNLVVLLDGSEYADQALPLAKEISQATGAHITLLSSINHGAQTLDDQYEAARLEREAHIQDTLNQLQNENLPVEAMIQPGSTAETTKDLIENQEVNLVVTTTRGKSGVQHWLSGGVSRKLVQMITTPIILVHANDLGIEPPIRVDRILVALDGSIFSERVLPYARSLAQAFDSELILMCVPAVPEVGDYRAPSEAIQTIRHKAEVNMHKFLEAVARSLREDGLEVRTLVTGSMPARTIVSVAKEEGVDMIMLTSRGRGGWDLLFMGSVAERVVQHTQTPVFMVPIHDRPD